MESIIKSVEKKTKSEVFEQKVLENLFIDSNVFDVSVASNRGYTLILRNWIKEAYLNGSTVEEVARTIKNSSLPLKELSEGKPLHLNNLITQLPRTNVSTLLF
ncbi:hypothetical protein [Aquimarina algiphila]|uniref:Uncharacterized protein n=1 Tax=Aquimarina algiphila TaxID=2047982 RepID=A0A554VEJ1_9FLAO|nr:hypothetical protein [Aquimarina algiphila]TSE05424.1 hypothetical protein FOF46_22945 [Aquimarina algiphila]